MREKCARKRARRRPVMGQPQGANTRTHRLSFRNHRTFVLKKQAKPDAHGAVREPPLHHAITHSADVVGLPRIKDN